MSNGLKNRVLIALVVLSIAAPVMTWYSITKKEHEKDEILRQQKNELARLTQENANLAKHVQDTESSNLSQEQLAELLRLRSEAGALRRQTNAMQRLRDENRRLQLGATLTQNPTPAAEAEFKKELVAELMDAARNFIAELPRAQQRFADEHEGKASTVFSELKNDFSTIEQRRASGLVFFHFVREDGPRSGDNLILAESGTHQTPEGQEARVYAFSDGQTAEVTSPDGKDSNQFFNNWEKEHLNSLPAER